VSEDANVLESIARSRLVAIVRAEHPPAELAAALADAGVRAVELSLAADGAVETIADWRSRFPSLLVGAGTVLDAEQARAVLDAGAQFMISPGVEAAVASVARDRGVPHIPGAATPTEIRACVDQGAELIKLFPAGPLGTGYLRQLLGPFPRLRLVPTGGIDLDNARAFLDAGATAVAVGSALVGAAATYQSVHSAARAFLDALATDQGDA
jgi:2-dehydro-3-deoxyphosphogluconate aldolase / (4S)-4-hydroxy-2-oxoglutarate aldolase